MWQNDADGTGVRQLTNNKIRDVSPDWSPDGRKIVYESDEQIFMINADGGKSVQLTCDTMHNSNPAWSPLGDKIAFESFSNVWVMDADGVNPIQLTQEVGRSGEPAWSPYGKHIAYMRIHELDNADIYVMRADGTEKRRITRTDAPIREQWPFWSPDERKIAFGSITKWLDLKRDGIYVMDANSLGEPELMFLGISYGKIDWFASPHSVSCWGKAPVVWGRLKSGF